MARKKSFWDTHKYWIIPVGIVAIILLILIMWFVGAYNGLITTREGVNNAWANVETQYQRRADLIPNLVETVGAFAQQEREVLAQVTEARSRVGSVTITEADLSDPAKLEQYQDAQQELGSAISRLLAVAESYPDLRSSENFLTLQSQLEGTENRISVARRDYNEAVRAYNIKTQRIPTVIVANMFGFDQREFFEADEGTDVVPVVDRDTLLN